MLKVPTSAEFSTLPFAERVRITSALRDLLVLYAMTEREDVLSARQRVLREAS